MPLVQTLISLSLAATAGFWTFRNTGRVILWHASRHIQQPGRAAVLAGCAGILAFALVVAVVYSLTMAIQRAIERRLSPTWDERERLAATQDRDL